MESAVSVFAYGSLGEVLQVPSSGGCLSIPLSHPAPLSEILKRLPVTPDSVQLVMVNHKAVSHAHVVRPEDRIAIFPKEYPIFADWVSLRTTEIRRPDDLNGA